MVTRLDVLNQNDLIQQYKGLAESIIDAEATYEVELPSSFNFSAKSFNNRMTIAKAGSYYFLATSQASGFIHFENLTAIKIFITKLFNDARERKDLDPSWKAFWFKEITEL